MTLIVEDGNIVENANTYVSLLEARDYADLRGVSLSDDDTALTVDVIKSMDFLESFRSEFKGFKRTSEQELQWPRSGVHIDGFSISNSDIPKELKNCQCELLMALSQGFTFNSNASAEPYLIMEKVGPLESEYSDVNVNSRYDTLPAFQNALSVLLKSVGVLSVGRA